MQGTRVKIIEDDNKLIKCVKVQRYVNEEKVSDYTAEVGTELIVKPLNKQKKKHRDRRVQIMRFLLDQEIRYGDLRVSVKFLDNNRRGIVPISDLDIFD
ncbi:hypothetical protein QUF56_12245 [Ureibacillus composti]|nr:hypothetical protein [Ureibacillus composti]